jgi:hypothetical protein
MIWRDGVLPPGSPAFSQQLSFDLHSYAYGLLGLGLGLRLLELDGDPNQARIAFEQAATALEAVMAKGNRDEADRDFHFVMAAASYHLAHLSARAYSLLAIVVAEENFSPIEQTLALLMRRDINELRTRVYAFCLDGQGSDATIVALFQQRLAEPAAPGAPERDGKDFLFEGLDLALTDAFFGALALFLLALDRGERALLDRAIAQLRENLDICAELNLLPQWWVHRVAILFAGLSYSCDALREAFLHSPERDVEIRADLVDLGWIAVRVGAAWHAATCNHRGFDGMRYTDWQEACRALRIQHRRAAALSEELVHRAVARISEPNRAAALRMQLTPFHVTEAEIARNEKALHFSLTSSVTKLPGAGHTGDPLEDGFDILPPEAPPSTHETPGAETPPASPNSAPRSKTWRFDDE